jgi:exodeoxyribonuclease-5
MQLTAKQEQGLKIAIERFKARSKYTVISGYAGSGKSTLVKFIVSALGVDESDVAYACYTGKAAQVLLKKGNKNVYTLHKLLYESHPLPNGKFRHLPVPVIPYRVVIVDEVSMAPKELMLQLFKYPVYVICLGDPFQLPPIDKDADNGLLARPHVFLDEIMRQAQESEIIQMTMKIRAGETLPLFDGKDVKILPKRELSSGMLTWADQVLCATNATRHSLNDQLRELLGKEGLPQEGDKVICLKNEWDTIADNEDPLVNGTIGYLSKPYETFAYTTKTYGPLKIEYIASNFVSDSGATFSDLRMDKKLFLDGEKQLPQRTEYLLRKNKNQSHLIPLEFDYGYAITTHKSQGSQWDKVLVVEEGFPFDKVEHARWLYTACTRAAEKLVLVKKD